MHSIGIDIGTSTTQCVFSSMRLVNQAPAFSVPRIALADKRVLHRAPLCLTPLLSPDTIDADAIRRLVLDACGDAGITPEQIDVGAVIITGETARKQNARAVTQALADFAGEFVVATAGPELEGILAGQGSGAAALSASSGRRVLNLDIGGGTTNMCLFSKGTPVETGCVDIGGRLLRRDTQNGTVLHYTQAMRHIARSLHIAMEMGALLTDHDAQRLVDRMARVLEEAAGLAPRTELYEQLVVEHGLPDDIQADIFTFSGGVANSLYGDAENTLFADDIGALLGAKLRSSAFFAKGRVLRPAETQYATVIGAGIYTVTLTGSTISYSGVQFPLLGLPVGKVPLASPEDIPDLPEHIRRQARIYEGRFALCFEGWRSPSYADVEAIAAAICDVLAAGPDPLVIVVAQDMSKALGQAVQRMRGADGALVCIDGIALAHGDLIDIGLPMADGRVLPVVVKTLAFSS